MSPREPMIEIPTQDSDGSASHLAVRHEPGPGDTDWGVLYLHGFGATQDGSKAEHFRQRVRQAGWPFCSFDFQGHGRSGASHQGLSLSRNLADARRVLAFLSEEGLQRVVVIGSSMGGVTGLWLSLLQPESVVGGVYLAPAVVMAEGVLAAVGRSAARKWEEDGYLDFETDLTEGRLGWGFITDFQEYPLHRLASELRVPGLILQGQKDDTVDYRDVLELTRTSRADCLELHLFGDGDHRLADRLDRLWALTEDFLLRRLGVGLEGL